MFNEELWGTIISFTVIISSYLLLITDSAEQGWDRMVRQHKTVGAFFMEESICKWLLRTVTDHVNRKQLHIVQCETMLPIHTPMNTVSIYMLVFFRRRLYNVQFTLNYEQTIHIYSLKVFTWCRLYTVHCIYHIQIYIKSFFALHSFLFPCLIVPLLVSLQAQVYCISMFYFCHDSSLRCNGTQHEFLIPLISRIILHPIHTHNTSYDILQHYYQQ